jgi:hypothetical protein
MTDGGGKQSKELTTRSQEPTPEPTQPRRQVVLWVVYVMTIHGKPGGLNAVCEQREWEEMELARPGYHKLVRAGITSEGEAERLARGGPSGEAAAAAGPRARRP